MFNVLDGSAFVRPKAILESSENPLVHDTCISSNILTLAVPEGEWSINAVSRSVDAPDMVVPVAKKMMWQDCSNNNTKLRADV